MPEQCPSQAAQTSELYRASVRLRHNSNRSEWYEALYDSNLKYAPLARTGSMTLGHPGTLVKVYQFRDQSVLIVPHRQKPFVPKLSAHRTRAHRILQGEFDV